MATQQENSQVSGWGKVVKWYASHAYAVNIIYSAGAAVVIIGALFKILHWPFASQILMVGMFTEAFLFTLGIFEKPHAVYHWENVFPQLTDENAKAPQTNVLGGTSALAEKDIKALQEGIANVGKAAAQLATLGEVATATNGLVEKMTIAGNAAEQFAATQTSLLNATEGVTKHYQAIEADVEGAANQTKAFGKTVEAINTQLSQINSVYELQLKEIQAQSAAYETLANQANELKQNSTASVEASKQYLAAQQKLAVQVADLNKVYGNMLSAL